MILISEALLSSSRAVEQSVFRCCMRADSLGRRSLWISPIPQQVQHTQACSKKANMFHSSTPGIDGVLCFVVGFVLLPRPYWGL